VCVSRIQVCVCLFIASSRLTLRVVVPFLFIIQHVAGEIIRLVASVCVSVRLSLLFEPFDL